MVCVDLNVQEYFYSPLASLLVHRRLVFSIFVTFPKHFCRYLDLYLHRYPKLIA